MDNTLFTLDIAKTSNTEFILAAKRYRLAKQSARHGRGKSPDKVHSVRRSSHSDETPVT